VTADDTTESNPEGDETEMGAREEARMSILEHLADLRIRIIYSTIWFALGFVVCWMFHEPLFEFLWDPLIAGADQLESEVSRDAVEAMHHKDVTEPIYVFLKVSALGGGFLAAPGIFYNIWRFIAPGLYPSEKRLVAPFVFFATLFFFAGAAFCYAVVLPYGYRFLLGFTNVSDPQIMMSEYFSTTTKLLFGFGVIFELPVFSAFLSKIGVITHRTLLEYWRYAVVAAFLLAALLTPPDIVTQAMMGGPLLVLYTLSVGVAWFFTSDDE